MSDSDIAGEQVESGDEIAGGAPQQNGLIRPRQQRFPVLLIGAPDGAWYRHAADLSAGRSVDRIRFDREGMWLVAVMEVWATLCRYPQEFAHLDGSCLLEPAVSLLRGEDPGGFVVYRISKFSQLAEPCLVADIGDSHEFWLANRHRKDLHGEDLRSLVKHWFGFSAKLPVPWKAATKWADKILESHVEIVHIVAWHKRLQRKLLMNSYPSYSVLQRFRSEVHAVEGAPDVVSRFGTVRDARSQGTVSAEALLRWLNATAYVKQVKQAEPAALAWAKVLLPEAKNDDLADLLPDDLIASGEQMRRHRVRLDLSSMLLFRLVHSNWQSPAYYLWSDASPQWKGKEFCASSFDCYVSGTLQRRKLLPCLALTRGRTTALQKCLALLWQIFLMVGADRVQEYCRSVRGIVTDMGSERLLCKMPVAVLQNFMRHIGSNAFISTDSPLIFSGALAMPGWRHCFDLVLRRGLWMMPWFPSWVKKLKLLVSWLRDDLCLITDFLLEKHMGGLASVLESASLPRFADWRWATLNNCLKSLDTFLGSLVRVYEPGPFKKSRDTVRHKAVTEALASPEWLNQFQVLKFYCGVMTDLLEWCGGCRCHGSNSSSSDRAQCLYKGRRLDEAFLHARAHLRLALDEINSWEPRMVGGDIDLLRQIQAVMRGTWMLSCEKIQFLDELPYLLARLHQPGVRDECLRQWEEVSPDAQDSVSAEFLQESSPLRNDILSMGSDGSGMTERLRQAFDSIRQVPIDDTPGESPHAQMKHISARTRAAHWPWYASSARLQQNLDDFGSLLPAVVPPTSAEFVWQKWSSVLQPRREGKFLRVRRMKRKRLEDLVYTTKQFANFRMTDMADGADLDDDGGDEGGGEDGCPVEDPEPEKATPAEDGWAQLLREYYTAAFKGGAGKYFSIVDAGGAHTPFQLLSFRHVPSLVATFRQRRRFTCKMGVQRFEVWAQRASGSEVHQLDVFGMSDPENIDLSDFIKSDMERHRVVQWREEPSDVQDCITLVSPAVLEPPTKLQDKKVPVLCLIDALRQQGFIFVERLCVHRPDDKELYLDSRKLHTKRHYLQAVLARQALWDRGEASFASNRSQQWYLLLLHNKLAGLTKANLGERLAALGDLDLSALKTRSTLRRRISDTSSIAGADALAADAADEIAGPVAAGAAGGRGDDEDGGESSSSSSASSSSAVGPAAAAGEGGYIPPSYIAGCRVAMEHHKGSGAVGLRIHCFRHTRCRKFCSLSKDPHGFGAAHAEIFLGAWATLPLSDNTQSEHQPMNPTVAQMRVYRESLP